MVIAAGKAESSTQNTTKTAEIAAEEKEGCMEMVPERSRSLHNFSTLPCFKWGKRKQLRCVKAPLDLDYPTSSSSSPNRSHRTPDRRRRSADDDDGDDGGGNIGGGNIGGNIGGGGIEAMREKLMLDFRSEVHQMKTAILTGKKPGELVGAPVPEPRPWNLRTRRAVCKEPKNNNINNHNDYYYNYNNSNNNGNSVLGGAGGCGSDRRLEFSPARNFEVKSPIRGFEVDVKNKGPRAKFSVSLSKQEIEEDFLSLSGTRPARRPKKRPRLLQKKIDAVFPGYWLTEITADMYKVNENPEASNKR